MAASASGGLQLAHEVAPSTPGPQTDVRSWLAHEAAPSPPGPLAGVGSPSPSARPNGLPARAAAPTLWCDAGPPQSLNSVDFVSCTIPDDPPRTRAGIITHFYSRRKDASQHPAQPAGASVLLADLTRPLDCLLAQPTIRKRRHRALPPDFEPRHSNKVHVGG